MLLLFLRQEGDVLFQQGNTCTHTAAAMQHVLRGVQQLPWPVRSPDLSSIAHVWDMMKWELILSPEPAETIAELQQQVQLLFFSFCHVFCAIYILLNVRLSLL